MEMELTQPERLPYVSPVLVEYGSLADLTLTATSGGNLDGGTTAFVKTSKA